MKFDAIGLQIPDILLPSPSIDPTNWAVVACDQYSSQPDYWQKVAQAIADSPSTGHMVFPEAWLESGNNEDIIQGIQSTMQSYLQKDVFEEYKSSLIRCRRSTSTGERKGVIVALDLEHYDYRQGSQTLIRATEGTIVDRLPPRIKIREGAALEFPHIMVLIDDPDRTVIEPLFEQSATPVYQCELMQNSGQLRGELIDAPEALVAFAASLEKLAQPDSFKEKYDTGPEQQPLLYAMGDGNHSFATARAIWEQMKADRGFDAVADHPARYALVELVNLYDTSLEFEAIHRVVFNTNPEALIAAFLDYYRDQQAELKAEPANLSADAQAIPFHYHNTSGSLVIHKPAQQLAAGSLQQFLDDYLKDNPQANVDYIHGESTTIQLGEKESNIGFLLPPIDKQALFKTVIFDGALPRKTFSMGEAQDKRFYFEGRRIQP